MKLGTISSEQLILSADQEAHPATMALNSIMELRYAVSRLGLNEAHDILDELERLIHRGAKPPV